VSVSQVSQARVSCLPRACSAVQLSRPWDIHPDCHQSVVTRGTTFGRGSCLCSCLLPSRHVVSPSVSLEGHGIPLALDLHSVHEGGRDNVLPESLLLQQL
jgi:hypothetical protein